MKKAFNIIGFGLIMFACLLMMISIFMTTADAPNYDNVRYVEIASYLFFGFSAGAFLFGTVVNK